MPDALNLSVEMIITLVLIVGSFMYVEEALMARGMIDTLLAVFVFGGGLIYLFSLVYSRN
jgi:hypothetical protein